MCGRYSQRFSSGTTVEGIVCDLPEMKSRYNTCPTQQGIIVRLNDDGEQYASLAKWGFLPQGIPPDWRQINARGETIEKKRMFGHAFREARCLVLMDGFTEWDRSVSPTQPYFFHRKEDTGFAVAGIWAIRESEDGTEELNYGIITTGPNKVMERIHDRMPVILNERDFKLWLDPKSDTKALKKLLVPCSDDFLTCHPISRRINKPANDTPDLLNPE